MKPVHFRLASFALCVVALLNLSACSEHVVDTFPEWCEQIIGVDLQEKYEPFWSVIFSIKFDGDEIRDDYVEFLNSLYMEKVGGRADQMVWREGPKLHLTNLSSFFRTSSDQFVDQWKNGISDDLNGDSRDPADICLYGTATSLFDSLHIHSLEPDATGRKWSDDVTVIQTQRKKRLGDKAL